MKQLLTLCLLVASQSFGQQSQPILGKSPDLTAALDPKPLFNRAVVYMEDKAYDVNGMHVVGSPYLFPEWCNGALTTADGKVFSGYKFKYNIFNQTVSFLSGNDSLEVNEPVQEFYLLVPTDGGVLQKFLFIHAAQGNVEGEAPYYQVLVDDERGQLLKLTRKFVAESQSSIPVHDSKKIFEAEVSFYYLNRQTSKISRIKGNGANVPALLGLGSEDKHRLNFDGIDFNRQDDLLNFFRSYFREKAPKTF